MIENLNAFFTKQNIEQLFELTGTWLLHENWGVKKPKNEEIGLPFTLYLHTFEKFKAIGIPFGNTAVTDKAKGNNQLINQKGKCEVICHLEKPFPKAAYLPWLKTGTWRNAVCTYSEFKQTDKRFNS